MHNHQLDTFIKVADAGSFNKASEELYISPNAVMKQINLLESSLGFSLFERTHRGIKLTAAGKSLYQDAKYLIEYSYQAIERARNFSDSSKEVLRIGTSLTTPVNYLINLWTAIIEKMPGLKFDLVSFENTPENAREIMKNFGNNIDLVVGIYNNEFLIERQCQALKLYDAPICLTMSRAHPLANRQDLTLADLENQKVMIIRQGYFQAFDLLRADLLNNLHNIEIIDIPFFNIKVFNRCENEEMILLTINDWHNIHPLLKTVKINWKHTIPVGILYSLQPSALVKRFLTVIEQINS